MGDGVDDTLSSMAADAENEGDGWAAALLLAVVVEEVAVAEAVVEVDEEDE